jgi:heme O synthase-like polyprenyltransferase
VESVRSFVQVYKYLSDDRDDLLALGDKLMLLSWYAGTCFLNILFNDITFCKVSFSKVVYHVYLKKKQVNVNIIL